MTVYTKKLIPFDYSAIDTADLCSDRRYADLSRAIKLMAASIQSDRYP